MKTMTRLFGLIFGLLCLVLPVACQGVFPPAKPDEIPIGLLLPLTGEFATTAGKDGQEGAELAVEQVNAAGGLEIAGKKKLVKLEIEDDQDSPDVALAALRKLAFQKQVVAIAGVPISRIAIPVAEFAETIPLPVMSSWSTHPQTTAGKRYIFRATVTDHFQGKAIAQFAYTHLQAQTAAILYDIASEYNKGLAAFFSQEFRQLGGTIVSQQTYTTDTNQDFTPQLKAIRDTSPDVLFLPNYSADLTQQVAQIQALEIKTTLLGGDTWGSLSETTLKQLEGGFYSLDWTPYPTTEQSKQFFNAYQQRYQRLPNAHAALIYDALGLLFAAIRQQGKTDPDSIREGLSQLKYEGVTGTIQFQGNGDPLKEIIILKIIKGKPMVFQNISPES